MRALAGRWDKILDNSQSNRVQPLMERVHTGSCHKQCGEAMYQSLVHEHEPSEVHEDADLQEALQQSLRPAAPPECPTEESIRLQTLLDFLGMKRLDVGSTNLSEGGSLLSNQCFYLAIARSWLASADNGSGMLVRDSALQLKREIEACVFCARGDAGELGDEAEAYTDYLSCVVQGQSPASASAITDLAIAIFASSLGGIEAYVGKGVTAVHSCSAHICSCQRSLCIKESHEV